MKPLTKKQRFLSISLLFLVFIIFAPIIIFYSLGYRLDDGFTFQKTGGIFIHSNIPNTSVFIDDEYYKDNGLFLRNTLVQDLIPNKFYTVRVQKEGYQSWVKDIFIYPAIVSEGKVLMLPENYATREILPFLNAEGVAVKDPLRAGIKPNNPEFISMSELFKPKEKEVEETKEPLMTLATEKNKTKVDIFFENINIEDYAELQNLIIEGKEVSWLDDGNIKLHWIDEKSTTPFYYCGGLERECKTDMVLDWIKPIKRFDYFPSRFDVWIVLVDDGIYAVEIDDRSERNIQTIYKGKDLDYRLVSGGRLLIKDGSSFFEINL